MVKAKTSTYEEIRKRRIEENMKKMQDLKLSVLSLSLRSPVKKHTKKVACRERNVVVVEKRRSGRIAKLDPPCYNEGAGIEARGPRSKRHEAKSDAQIRAQELHRKLCNGNPSFVKKMKPSHVSGGFWLGLDVDFCGRNFPWKGAAEITLIDENGQKWPTKYLDYKHGLSGGWRGFSIEHKLGYGDVLVFELIDPLTFKVYIVKEKHICEVMYVGLGVKKVLKRKVFRWMMNNKPLGLPFSCYILHLGFLLLLVNHCGGNCFSTGGLLISAFLFHF